MTAYAIGHFLSVDVGPDIVAYLEKIDSTLEPYGGRFLVHGAKPSPLEGDFKGDLVVIAFPDMENARSWYDSPGYREILPLRLRNAVGEAFLIEGCDETHKATDILAA